MIRSAGLSWGPGDLLQRSPKRCSGLATAHVPTGWRWSLQISAGMVCHLVLAGDTTRRKDMVAPSDPKLGVFFCQTSKGPISQTKGEGF